ncbi:MAG: DNA internalization-related competence protein ComEC/Rec2 [Planctomycetaceae bacterium]|nr:DNA internalization-related competence protein ComEC/Rec2 [Planctomycetaceae bacterium]
MFLLTGYLIQQTRWLDLTGWFVALMGAMIALSTTRWARHRSWRVLGFVCVLIALGGFWSQLREPGQHPTFRQLLPRDSQEIRVIRVRGTVTSITPSPHQKPRDLFESFRFTIPKLKFSVQTEAYETSQGWEPLRGRLDCTLESPQMLDEAGVAYEAAQEVADGETPAVVDIGQQVQLLGRISLPPPSKNPRQLDYRRYLWLNGFDGQLTMNHPGQIEITRKEWHWSAAGDRLRQYFKTVLRRHVADEQYPLAAAILLGDRSMLDVDLRQQYAATGTVHVLAISGLHLGILAGAILWWSRWSFVPQRPVLIGTILMVLFYAWLVEFRPPIVRAAVLTTIMCVATLIGRRALSFNSLAVALVVVFAIQPHQIAEAGTQLSFLAVAGIVVFAQHRARVVPSPLQELRESRYTTIERVGWGVVRAVREVYLCGLAVFVAGLPLVMHYFNLLAWIGLLINPLVILPMTFALLSGFAVLVTAPVSDMLASGLGWMCGTSLDLMNGIVEWSYVLPGSYLWVTSPGWGWIILWYLWWVLLLWDPGITRRVAVGGCALLCVAAYIWPSPPCPDRTASGSFVDSKLTLTFVDVGHGSSVLIRTPENHVILFDAGSAPSARAAGQRISGVLLAHGILRIDQMVVSHADLDHYNGVPELLRRFSIREFVSPPNMLSGDSPYIQLLSEYLAREKVPLTSVQAGQFLWQEPGLNIRVLSPVVQPFPDGDNSNSLVLLVEYGSRRILLTADVEGAGLQSLLEQEPGNFDIIQVPHHGSRESQPKLVANWAKSDHAILSGLERRISPETIEAYQQVGTKTWITDQVGAILVGVHESGEVTVRAFLSDPWRVR